jgi:hypothetical protein
VQAAGVCGRVTGAGGVGDGAHGYRSRGCLCSRLKVPGSRYVVMLDTDSCLVTVKS